MHRNYYVVAPFWDHQTGVYRSFFGLESSVSKDLVHWDRAEEFRLPRLEDVYAEQRDPFVFWDEAAGCWRCVMTCGLRGVPVEGRGTVGLFTSPDLRAWQHDGALLPAGLFPVIECPQMFCIGRRWYLIGAIGSPRGVGGLSYWTAAHPTGPWTPTPRYLDGPDFCAPQVATDERGRWLAMGWIPLTSTAIRQHWGGHLSLPREVFAFPDGTLGMRLEPSVARAIRGPLIWSGAEGYALRGSAGLIEVSISGSPLPQQAEVVFESTDNPIRVVVRADLKGVEVWAGGMQMAETNLPPYNEAKDLECQMVFEDDLLELFIGDAASLAVRLPAPLTGSRIRYLRADAQLAPAVKVFELRVPMPRGGP